MKAGLPALGIGLLAACAAGAAHAAPAADSPTQPIPYAALAAPPAAPGDVDGELAAAARANGLDPALIRAVALQESGLRPDAKSHRGALGVMQLTPDTARDLGVDPHDLHENIQGGAAYLRTLLLAFGGDVAKALAAYNAGPGAVERYGGVPPFEETRNYVASIMGRLAVGAAAVVGGGPLPSQAARAAVQVAAGVGARTAQATVAAIRTPPRLAIPALPAASGLVAGEAIATAIVR